MKSPTLQQIDFLPDKYRQARSQKTTRNWQRIVLCILGMLLVTGGAGDRMNVQRLIAKRNQLRASLLETQRHLAPDDSSNQLTRSRSDDAKLLTLLSMRPSTSRILTEIAGSTPANVTLKTVVITEHAQADSTSAPAVKKRKGATSATSLAPVAQDLTGLQTEFEQRRLLVQVEGTATGDGDVSQFLASLEGAELFREVRLKYSETLDGPASSGRKFAFDAHLRHADLRWLNLAPSPEVAQSVSRERKR